MHHVHTRIQDVEIVAVEVLDILLGLSLSHVVYALHIQRKYIPVQCYTDKCDDAEK